MPEPDDFKKTSTHAVINEIAHPAQVAPPHYIGTRRLYFGANSWFACEQGQGRLQVFPNRAWRCGPVFCRRFGCPLNFARCARFDAYRESQDQPRRRSRANRTSAGIPSSRSASSSAASSSACSPGGKRTAVSSPRASTVTAVPSGRERPSTTTLPSITVPEASCI